MAVRALVLALISALMVCMAPLTRAETVLVAPGSAWRYLDNGVDQGTNWRGLNFDDSAWPVGLAQFGYGDGDEVTTNSFGADPDNKFITYYYRYAFVVPNPGLFSNLMVRLLRDDGAVVYLNGVEVFRNNMPAGPVVYATPAATAAGAFFNETNYFEEVLAPSLLRTGPNVLAVEVHQVNAASSDLSFDLELVANFFRPPTLIPFGAVWRYLDDGSDQGTAWRARLFADGGWAEGMAQLGYGEGDEATVINGGPDTNRFVTTYFRRAFVLSNPGTVTNLILRVIRDDGAIVYLNGMEVLRSYMPEDTISYTTLASGIVDGAGELEVLQTNVAPALLVAGTNVVAVEIHQANNTSSDLSFALELRPNNPPGPPEVIITSPADQSSFAAPPNSTNADVAIGAFASDFDGFVTRVDFYVNNLLVGRSLTTPYVSVASNLATGSHRLTAVAMDNSGLISTSAPVQVKVLPGPITSTLLAAGSTWKYLDDGSDQHTVWKEAAFDDSSWATGAAKFGYGDPAATVLAEGPAGARYLTHYFRHKFMVSEARRFTNLFFRVLRDDGVVAYLNGQEAFRMNMPAGPVSFTTLASSAVGTTNETFYFPTNVGAFNLAEGSNLIAVELHQNSPGTLDGGFDLILEGISDPDPKPFLQVARTEAGVLLSWSAAGAVLEAAGAPTGPWSAVQPQPVSPFLVTALGNAQFYRLRVPGSSIP